MWERCLNDHKRFNPSLVNLLEGRDKGRNQNGHCAFPSVKALHFYRGSPLIRNRPPSHHRTLGKSLLQGPRRGAFLMSEVPL